jgi:hypothetical protein
MHTLSKRLARVMVCGALVAALIMAVAHGAERGTKLHMQVALIIGLACVAIGEFLAWHNAASAWHERRSGSVALWACLGVILSGGTLYTNFSSAAANNDLKTGVQKAAFVTQGDVDKTEAMLEKKVSRLEERLRMMPARTAEAARAAQDNARAHRWWGVTDGCKTTKGPDTRKFCSEYASAVADESMAKDAMTRAEELKMAQAELATLRTNRAGTGAAVVSDEQAGVAVLASLLRVDVQAARQTDSMILPLLVQAMLLIGGICLASETYRHTERRPWVNWSRFAPLGRRLIAWWRDQTPEQQIADAALRHGRIEVNQTVTDERGVNELWAKLNGALNPPRERTA